MLCISLRFYILIFFGEKYAKWQDIHKMKLGERTLEEEEIETFLSFWLEQNLIELGKFLVLYSGEVWSVYDI